MIQRTKSSFARIGIPQALLYYKYYPFWKTFLERLGFQVVVSPATNREIFYDGINICMDEACFPVKVFCGHIAALKDKADCIFIPRIASVEKRGFLCSKFSGLPDIVRNLFPDCHVLSPNIDLNQDSLFKTFFTFGLQFTRNPIRILSALRAAQDRQEKFLNLMHEKRLTPPEAIEFLEQGKQFSKVFGFQGIKIAILGHPYNLYDDFINLDMLKRLKDMHVEILTLEMVPEKRLIEESRPLWNIYWTYDRELAAAAMYFSKQGIDGIIFIVSFPCGPDSLVIDYLTRKLGQRIPILNLVIDEHRGDAGFLTRLESFVDLIRRKKHEV